MMSPYNQSVPPLVFFSSGTPPSPRAIFLHEKDSPFRIFFTLLKTSPHQRVCYTILFLGTIMLWLFLFFGSGNRVFPIVVLSGDSPGPFVFPLGLDFRRLLHLNLSIFTILFMVFPPIFLYRKIVTLWERSAPTFDGAQLVSLKQWSLKVPFPRPCGDPLALWWENCVFCFSNPSRIPPSLWTSQILFLLSSFCTKFFSHARPKEELCAPFYVAARTHSPGASQAGGVPPTLAHRKLSTCVQQMDKHTPFSILVFHFADKAFPDPKFCVFSAPPFFEVGSLAHI